jgi:hypothetical protein
MDRKSYPIPLGWYLYDRLHGEPIVLVNSRTLVLAVPPCRSHGISEFEITRISGSPSPHVPEKKPRYRVEWGGHYQSIDELELVRLSTLSPGEEVFIPLETRRSQTCIENNGRLHGIFVNRDDNPRPYCGEYLKHVSRTISDPSSGYVKDVMPTCSKCIEHKVVWHLFRLHPFAPKREVIRIIDKVKAEERRRASYPTAYDRILDDSFLDDKPPEPVVTKRLAEEAEDDDELIDPRDRKRASAIDRNRRFETAKAQVKGHR